MLIRFISGNKKRNIEIHQRKLAGKLGFIGFLGDIGKYCKIEFFGGN